jgi:carotenoid 1,2-hydratase
LRGREHPSGRGGADGGLVRAPGRGDRAEGLGFAEAVPAGGYAWWYVDAISDCGAFGLTIIAFLGSVFSPYYKKSGRGDPIDHACINVALYGPKGARWTMTERGRESVSRGSDHLAVGDSVVRWMGDALVIDIEEKAIWLGVPYHPPVRGRVVVEPEMWSGQRFALDPEGRHEWRSIAPRARVRVEMERPELSWSGSGYLDANRGSEALEEGFADWQWSRAHMGDEAAVLYEGVRRDGSSFASALRFDGQGRASEEELPLGAPLPATRWLMGRRTRADRGHARVVRTWEDSPFYARSAVASRLFGRDVLAVHESLSLDRFRSPVVQWMLPYKMPRRG